MTDLMGLEVTVDDEIIFTSAGRGRTDLTRGQIIEILSNGRCKIKSHTGRIQQNTRRSNEIMSLTPHKEANPELFI